MKPRLNIRGTSKNIMANIKLYIEDIREHSGLSGIELVTQARRAKIERLLFLEAQARSLAAGLLLREVLDVVDDSQIYLGRNNKPYLTDNSCYFSLAHSGNYAVLAVCEQEIGVDIEKRTRCPSLVLSRCFTPQEREWVLECGSPERFAKLWTAKEAAAKLTGEGITLTPQPIGDDIRLDWRVHDGHIICTASFRMK